MDAIERDKWEPREPILPPDSTDNAVLLATIRDLAETRERLGRASGHITAARVHQENRVAWLKLTDRDTFDETNFLAALVAAEKEIANADVG